MLVLNNTPFVHARVYLQYFKSALPGLKTHDEFLEINLEVAYHIVTNNNGKSLLSMNGST